MQSVICIPGEWKERTELITALATSTSYKYVLAGSTLFHAPTGNTFEVEICDRDTRMTNSFRVAGLVNRVTESFLQEIEQHSSVVYLTSEGGNMEAANALSKAALEILNSGGIGVKVETAGKAFMRQQWNELANLAPEAGLYKLFVLDAIIAGDSTVFLVECIISD